MFFQHIYKITASSSKITIYQYFQKLHRGFSFLDILKMSIFQKPTRLYFLSFYNVLNNSTKSSHLYIQSSCEIESYLKLYSFKKSVISVSYNSVKLFIFLINTQSDMQEGVVIIVY
jgi:hypothetical protein